MKYDPKINPNPNPKIITSFSHNENVSLSWNQAILYKVLKIFAKLEINSVYIGLNFYPQTVVWNIIYIVAEKKPYKEICDYLMFLLRNSHVKSI